MNTTQFHHYLRFVLLLVLLAAGITGCNIVSPIAYLVGGTGTIDAQIAIPDQPTLVFVDDRASLVNPRSLRQVIAERISEDLMVKGVVATTISPADAMAYASHHDRQGELLSMGDIGEAVGADTVIYIEMLAFARYQTNSMPRPYATCRVRVLNVKDQTRIYPPPDSDIQPPEIQAVLLPQDPELFRQRATAIEVYEQLAEQLGRNVALLFYDHERIELGERLESR